MKKVLLALIVLFISSNAILADEIDKFVAQSGFEHKSVVSIFVKDSISDEVIYKRNENKLLNPASILKTLTYSVSKQVLGADYRYETAIYKDKNSNNLYLKLGADPLLTTSDLVNLFNTLKTKIDVSKMGVIYIDDTIIDKTPYPKGWMNDDMWPKQRALTPYIIDNNRTQILVKRSSLSTRIDIIQDDEYKLPIINELILKDKDPNARQNIKIVQKHENSALINFQGTVVKDELINLPVLNPELHFKIKAFKALNKAQISYDKKLFNKTLPQGAIKIASVGHTQDEIAKEILYNSNNFVAEIVFKIAAAKYINYNHPATNEDAIKMFNEIIQNEDIKITDASGVSRYNTLSAESLVETLCKLDKNVDLKHSLPTSGSGTLKNRLDFLKDNVRAKTGTLSKMSSIAGFLTTAGDKDIVFAIIVQNSHKRSALLKNFEDNIVTLLYRKY